MMASSEPRFLSDGGSCSFGTPSCGCGGSCGSEKGCGCTSCNTEREGGCGSAKAHTGTRRGEHAWDVFGSLDTYRGDMLDSGPTSGGQPNASDQVSASHHLQSLNGGRGDVPHGDIPWRPTSDVPVVDRPPPDRFVTPYRPPLRICCWTCKNKKMVQVCGYSLDGGLSISESEYMDDWYLGGRTVCNVPCLPEEEEKPCDPLDPTGSSGAAPFDPNTQCCENGEVVDKVRIYAISRDEGGKKHWTDSHSDIMLPVPSGDPVYNEFYEHTGEFTGGGDITDAYVMAGFFGIGSDTSGDPIGCIGLGIDGNWNTTHEEWMSEADYPNPEVARERVDRTRGREGGRLSTICAVLVCPSQARRMWKKLAELRMNPGAFSIALGGLTGGGNCAGGAAEVLSAGDVLPDGIPGIDSPLDLLEELVESEGGECFLGYTRIDEAGLATIERPEPLQVLPHELPFFMVEDFSVSSPNAPR